MKVVDTREYVSMFRELTEEGKEVSVLISGNSMSPFLVHGRDSVYFKKPEHILKKGDMVFYERRNGQFVMHRICKVENGKYYLIGDAQQEVEGPLERDQIFAIVTRVRRKGKWLEAGDFWWEFFERVWIRVIPLRHMILRIYKVLNRKGKE